MTSLERRSWPTRTIALGAALLVLAVVVGVYVGLRSPWGTKHPQVKHGVAVRANSEDGLVMFDADDGTQLTLDADSVWWETESAGSEGDPPCLKEPGKKATVEVGLMWVAGPSGGSRAEGLWLKCL